MPLLPPEIERELDIIESHAVALDVISSFAARGWALYEWGGGPTQNYFDFQPAVEMGRAKNGLLEGIPFIILPLVEHDECWNDVFGLWQMVINKGNGPYWMEFEDDQEWAIPIARFLIDTMVYVPPLVHLVFDQRFTRVTNPEDPRWLGMTEIEIPVWDLGRISGYGRSKSQLMKAMR